MRLEDQGKEVKKTGFLRGTRMWTIRNRIIAGVIGCTLLFDLCWILYANKKKDVIKERHERRQEAVSENKLELSRRIKALEERRTAIQDVTKTA